MQQGIGLNSTSIMCSTCALVLLRLFTLHPELAEPYGADGIDPDSIVNSQKFIMYGMSELQYFFKLPEAVGDERQWRQALTNFKEHYGDIDASLKEFHVCHFCSPTSSSRRSFPEDH